LQSLQSEASRSLRNVTEANFGNAMFYMNDHSVRKGDPVTTGILGQFLRRRVSSMLSVLCGLLKFIGSSRCLSSCSSHRTLSIEIAFQRGVHASGFSTQS
jgi:hypothetical protein